jgi:hypothetical protein
MMHFRMKMGKFAVFGGQGSQGCQVIDLLEPLIQKDFKVANDSPRPYIASAAARGQKSA